jgi:hypothetical protein
MGLDISYYSNVKHIPWQDVPQDVKPFNAAYDKWEEEYPEHYLYYINKKGSYFPKHLEGLEEGWYLVPRNFGRNSFRAGSYSSYNQWRDDLALAAVYEGGAQDVWSMYDESIVGEPESPPFLELINFSDSDGIIGPKVSEKLYNDFVKYEPKIKKKIDFWELKFDPNKQDYSLAEGEYFINKYNEWKEAFRVASQNGFVSFH